MQECHYHLPLCAGLCVGLLISCDFSLAVILFTWLVCEITEGEAGGRDLVIC